MEISELTKYKVDTMEEIARLCHNVNRAYCKSIGDDSQPTWKESPEWQKVSAIRGVLYHLRNDVTPEESHVSWMKEKEKDGWVWGLKKDSKAKTHPCMVSYYELSEEQRTKDFLFKAVVESFKSGQ